MPFERLREAVPEQVAIHYSVKANPSLAVCSILRSAGARAEIASAGELEVALRAGFSAEHVLFAGPGKTDAELEAAVRARIGAIHAESSSEADRIDRIARAQGVVQPVALRVNVEARTGADARIVTGGGAQKFGIDYDQCDEAIARVRRASNTSWNGLHFFSGSQFRDHRALLRMIDAALDTARSLATRAGEAPPVIDLGGGIGVSHTRDEEPFDIEAFGAGLAERLETCASESTFEGTKFVLEPGRALVSEAGVYLARVLDVKTSGGQRFAIVDGGIHHALLPITSNRYRVVLANRMSEPDAEDVTLGGPLCTSADQWASAVALPEVREGDLIAVLNSGAYGLSAGMTLFLSHGVPAEVLIENDRASLIRRRDEPADLLRGQQLPTEPNMTRLTTIEALRSWCATQRAAGHSIGLVPTLGCLHDGHATLVRAAAKENDRVVVSAFVNPIQFRREKYEQYPRDLDADEDVASAAGAHALFAPSWQEMYPGIEDLDQLLECQDLGEATRPESQFTHQPAWGPKGPAFVRVPKALALRMDGVLHPWHFDGVATVVARLFELVGADRAYFGEKDPQQVAILAGLARWLPTGPELRRVPTIRDPDGLASSSRNTQLSGAQRLRAVEMAAILRHAAAAVCRAETSTDELRARLHEGFSHVDAKLDYVDLLGSGHARPAASWPDPPPPGAAVPRLLCGRAALGGHLVRPAGRPGSRRASGARVTDASHRASLAAPSLGGNAMTRSTFLSALLFALSPPAMAQVTSFYVEECSLSCTSASGAVITCPNPSVFVNDSVRVRFTEPVDLASLSLDTFGIRNVGNGLTVNGNYEVLPSDPYTVVFTPAVFFDAAGNPVFAFEDGATYSLSINGVGTTGAPPFLRSVNGVPNATRVNCWFTDGSGRSNPRRHVLRRGSELRRSGRAREFDGNEPYREQRPEPAGQRGPRDGPGSLVRRHRTALAPAR